MNPSQTAQKSKATKSRFDALVDMAMQRPGLGHLRPVVEKEVLHYDIFQALDNGGFLKSLVFQGGTCLRLCRGGNRFSEDLDFAGGTHFSMHTMKDMKDCIEDHIRGRYGLKVSVKPPKDREPGKPSEGDIHSVHVDKWLVAVESSPENRSLPQQKIKIEIANIPAYTAELVPLRVNYDFLAGMRPVLVPTESMAEVMADKILAFPTSLIDNKGDPVELDSKKIRHRDIWDLAWLSQQATSFDPEMVKNKARDYGIADYRALLSNAIERLTEIVRSAPFRAQMSRFVDAESIGRTLANSEYLDYTAAEVGRQLSMMMRNLSPGAKP